MYPTDGSDRCRHRWNVYRPRVKTTLKQHFTGARSELNITSIDFRDYNGESEALQNASIIINFGCGFNSYSSEQPWPLSRPCGHPNCKLMLLNYSTVTVPHKGAPRASGGAVPHGSTELSSPSCWGLKERLVSSPRS